MPLNKDTEINRYHLMIYKQTIRIKQLQVGWGFRIHRLHFCWRVSNKECPDDEALVMLELWGMQSTIYQPLRSGRIWHKVNF